MDGRFRLFIEIPIYNHEQQYTLFEIFNLPKVTVNATHGVVFSDLPNFLTVSTDLETFIELSNYDVQSCRKLERQLCNFHTGLSKRGARKSCVVSLFLEDSTRQSTQCKQKFIEWRGPEIAYSGISQWAFSAAGPHDVVFSCPVGVRHLPPRTIHLPSSEIFEVPAGCTARTEDWVFPASLEGRLEPPSVLSSCQPCHLRRSTGRLVFPKPSQRFSNKTFRPSTLLVTSSPATTTLDCHQK